MAKASGVALEIQMEALPIMEEALAMYRKGMNTGTNAFNRRLVAEHTLMQKQWPAWHQQIIYDPQTSGGLLAAVPADQAADTLKALEAAKTPAAAIIGRVLPLQGDTHLIFA
jgi:selenide, water dikinase